MEMISGSLEYLGCILCFAEIYERLYTDVTNASILKLRENLLGQYLSILKYILYVKRHLMKNTASMPPFTTSHPVYPGSDKYIITA
jgi:hypothetical protein